MFLRKYGVAATIDGIPLIARGVVDYKNNPALVAGDVQISKDGGTYANITTLPVVTPAGGTSIRIDLSAAEMQAARIVVRFVDQTATKEWEDQEIIVETFGNISAQISWDLSAAGINVLSSTQGAIQVRYAQSANAVYIVQGDSISIPYGPLNKDITGRKVYFAAKSDMDNTGYAIPVREITTQISDRAKFKGIIPLTSAESNIAAGDYYAELESRDADGTSNPVTELQFIMKVAKAVIS